MPYHGFTLDFPPGTSSHRHDLAAQGDKSGDRGPRCRRLVRICVAHPRAHGARRLQRRPRYARRTRTKAPRVRPAGGGALPESHAHYTGGWARSASAPASGGGHVAIGFESLSWAHEDLVPLCVLRTLLGGGSSFSSGGPGKGMYTRLYTGVLNVHGWVDACAAFNHVYSDTGLFGISASCVDGAYLPHLVDVTTEQVGAMARVPSAEELGRAKAMTAAALVMDLESRAVLCEDIGRQLAIGDTYMTVEEVLKQVEAVTGEQLAALAARVTGGKPTVVVVGDAYETASYEEIASAVHKQISA
eukprot:TRINITY_DN938_c0_g1_i6.p1 TRINITY_DN938_c0_g1~~TRINITY_DN938_c0_g1_i6.p1  ORF type:complete len:302 (-),score=71.66 TRINITY_DN938_c0_g1_i6:38-943(-)